MFRAVAGAVALIALVAAEFALVGDRVTRNLQLVLRDEADGAAGTPAGLAPPVRPPDPLPVLASAAAGPIEGVDLRLLRPCQPGQRCDLLAQVRVRPQTGPLPITWHVEVLDRCGPGRGRQPGATMEIQPGADRVVALLPVALPPGRALAVAPVVTEPALVAGRALPVPTGVASC
jgi:hypothetical protein